MAKELPADILFWVYHESGGRRVVTSSQNLNEFAEDSCIEGLLSAVASIPDELHLTLRKGGFAYSGNYRLKRPVKTTVDIDRQKPCTFILYSRDPNLKSS